MVGYLKRWVYRRKVLAALYAVLYLYPDGRDQILKHYPGVRSSLNQHYKAGTKHQVAGVLVGATILSDLLEKLDMNVRAEIDQQLRSQGQEKFKEMLRQQMDGQSSFPSDMKFATIMLGTAIVVARKMRDSGEIDSHTYNIFESEIFGTLRGQSSRQRSDQRVSTFLDDLLDRPHE